MTGTMTMTTRRLLLAAAPALFAAPLLAVPPLAGRAFAATPDAAAAFVDQLLRDLLAIANGAEPQDAKRAALARVIEQRVDVDAVARFCLGRFWRIASPQQQADYVVLFRRVLVKNVSERVGEYQGVTYSLGRALQREGDIAVSSIVNRPGNAPNKVDWVVGAETPPRVIDVVAEGTSLRLTQRSDYAAFLARNGNNVQALIDALRQQAAAG
jgi:phospholipid transport system substrate-binding protein